MTWEIAFMLALLVVMLAAFIWERVPVELTAMSAFALLLVLGLLSPDGAMAVFANAGPIAVGAMFIISAALERCGAIELVASGLNRMPKMGITAVLPLLILLVAGVSAFINNTPVVIVFLPIVLSLARKMEIPASKLLIPLSYASIFGGTCTLVGTSTNIIVSSMGVRAGLPPFGMFELAAVGVPLAVAGTLFLTLLGPRLLPVRETITAMLTEEERREYIAEAYIKEGSPMIGRTLADTPLGKLRNFRVIELLRHGVRLPTPPMQTQLAAGDRLVLAMSPRAIPHAHHAEGIDLLGPFGEGLAQISLSEGVIVEGVLGPDSKLIGLSLAELNFRQRYRMVPIAVHRQGKRLRQDFENIKLAYGDTLLLLGTREAIDQMRGGEDILILDRPPVILEARRRKLPLIVAVIGGVITAATTGLMPIAAAAIIGCVVLLLTKCITTKEAYESIHWPILFLIFAMLGVGTAMETTGTSAWLAERMVGGVSAVVPESWRLTALLAGVYLMTTVLTELLSNNAAAVLLATIAICLAESFGVDARPFLIAIAVAASASFATPIGYQTNTYVYGVGGYRFADFVRIGVPLNVLAFIVTMAVIPLVWPF